MSLQFLLAIDVRLESDTEDAYSMTCSAITTKSVLCCGSLQSNTPAFKESKLQNNVETAVCKPVLGPRGHGENICT
eukprot:2527443-Amphidinium_carterae.1